MKILKVTADKHTKHFQTQKVEFEDSTNSYKKISNPIFSYIYEQLEKMRMEDKTA